jgi:nucleoside-triphosphatase THEP1
MNPWVAIVGSRSDGRHEVLGRLHGALRSAGVPFTGFLQEPRDEEGGRRLGYDLVDVATGERRALARESREPRMCSWGFDPDAFALARRWVERDAAVSVLELGRLEAAEDGHWPAALSVLSRPGRLVVLGIRASVLAPIAVRLPDPEDAVELPASPREIDHFIERVVSLAAEV